MKARRIRRLVSAAGLPLVGILGMAALASAPGVGCAQAGHEGDVAGDDGGGSSSRGGGSGGGSDAGSEGSSGGATSCTPQPVNVALFTAACTKGQPTVDWSPMRRISRIEYDNMVRDLLGDTTQPAVQYGFPPESPIASGVNFNTNTCAPPSATAVTDYLQAAEGVAASAVADTNRMNNVVLAGIASCSQAHDDTCATDFIGTWADRAYRGQMDPTEAAGLFSVYTAVKTQFDWATGIQAIITAVLESPRFLYVMEFGSGSPSGNAVSLSSYEVAARLALFLWRSVPDAALMTAAAAGQLATPVQVQAQATRMLAATDGQGNLLARSALDDFTTQWMQLTPIQAKDSQFASFNSANATGKISAAMDDEARLDFSQRVLAESATLSDVLTSTSSYINSDLATLYGVSQAAGGVTVTDTAVGSTTFAKTAVPNRPGILATGAVMATQAHSTLPSFVLRGKLVRENVLCDPIPPPPPNVPAGPTMAPDGGTTRDLLLAHQQKGTACPGCHQYMDTIGVGFGNFDATGVYQANDANGLPAPAGGFPAIDASGTIKAFPGDPGGLQTTYTNVNDLVTQLAAATQVNQCFALQELRYATSRVETPSDACSAQQIYAAFSSNNFNVQQLVLAIVTSDAFRYRSVMAAGSECE
jgi:Protein of unknown function (DUF1592)/Protein of unknown function (DUF1588)/Protein of unknown function (DUF1585)/Protein of unknown function (DUF1595)/Protein of unknown function (DUF1587)